MLSFVLIFLFCTNCGQDASPEEVVQIRMDGHFSDWDSVAVLYQDPADDQKSGNVDFSILKITNDSRFVYFFLDIGTELNLQAENKIALYLDTDNDPNTGTCINNIGAEIRWVMGERSGNYSSDHSISQIDLGLVTAPTVSSHQFEIAIDRTSEISGQRLFEEDSFRVIFHDQGTGCDYIPDRGKTISYKFKNSPLPKIKSISLKKPSSTNFRVMNYNILTNNLFDPNKYDNFDRIISSISPDIIGFEEIYNKTANQVKQQLESILPLATGEDWYCGTIDEDDIFVTSKFPILDKYALNKSGAFLLDLSSRIDSELLLIVAHLSFGDYNRERQLEIDEMMAFIRDAKERGGSVTLEQDTPILIIGDLNLVGYAQQLETLLSGDVVNPQFKPKFVPDWDSSNFSALEARLTALPMFYTWYSATSTYSPGKLDFMIYSDYVLNSEKSFILFTPEMHTDTLQTHGLKKMDATIASDHLPLVSDFKIIKAKSD